MKIDSDQFTNIKMIYDIFGSKISELNAITGCDTKSYKSNAEKVYVLKKVCKDPSFTFIKILELNITLTEKLSKRPEDIRSNLNI